MKIQTQELTGPALDWAVTKCGFIEGTATSLIRPEVKPYSTDWAQGGPIIQREGIGIHVARWDDGGEPEIWYASAFATSMSVPARTRGQTALVAAMRCYVLSELGDEVDVPDELAE
jgi:hypothetical protein